MGKAEQLIEYNVQDIVEYIMQDSNMELEDAMNQFYSSATFDKLQDVSTGLYVESPAYVYEIYKDEIKNGKLIQKEV